MKPERTYRVGRISASVFLNAAKDGQQFRSVTLQRQYQNGETAEYTSSFTLADLSTALRLLEMARAHIESKEVIHS